MIRLSYKNLLIILGTLFIIGGVFVFFDKVVLNDPILSRIFPRQQLAWVNSAGLSFGVNATGIQDLSYNGVSFVSASFNNGYGAYYHDEGVGAVFQAPGGATTTRGSTVGDVTAVETTGSTTCPITKTNEQCFQQIYFPGQNNSYTLTMELSTYDSKTILDDIYITNNDATNTITTFTLNGWLGSSMVTPDLAPYHDFEAFGIDHATSPVAFIPGSSWGSMAFYTDNYAKNVRLYTSNTYNTSNSSTPPTNVNYIWNLNAGDSIAPGQTYHYGLYIRFGSTADTMASLTPEALSTYRTAYPYLLNWANRNPIARWFVAEGNHTSSSNPRGYLWDASLDVSNQSNFSTQILAKTDEIVTRMNGMNPKPQGIIVWDLEGEEFSQPFTYVGYPNKLHDLAPEMDAVADQMFQKFKDAGYKIGITLRPSGFLTGTTLPSTCNVGGNGNYDDIFIKLNDAYPDRGYECTSPNTWTHLGDKLPNHQTYPQTDAGFLQNLKDKITYAYNRWGTTMFYVDSTVYGEGGNAINGQIFTDLMTYLQTTAPYSSAQFIIFPEEETTSDFRSTAAYNQVDMGVYDTDQNAKDIYPGAFSVLAHVDGSEVTHHDQLVQSLKNGNIFFDDNIWYAVDTAVQQLYLDASSSNFIGDIVAPTISVFSIPTTASSLTVSIPSFVASDNTAVTGYLVNESSVAPAASDAGWSGTVPTSYMFGSEGSKTLYAWAKDAAGNVSASVSGSVVVTLPVVAPSGGGGGGGGGGTISSGGGGLSTASETTSATTSTTTSTSNISTCPHGFVCVQTVTIAPAPQGGPIGSVIPSVYLDLALGSRSTAVLTLQKYLINGGYLASNLATGYYGILTSSAVSHYQTANISSNANSASSGQVGFLSAYLFLGTNSQQVKALQQILNKRGFIVAASGPGSAGNESTYFSTSTQSALQRFQCSGLGVCSGTPLTSGYGATGPRTRALLNSSVYVSTSTPLIVPVVSPSTSSKTNIISPKETPSIVTPTISFPVSPAVKANQVY